MEQQRPNILVEFSDHAPLAQQNDNLFVLFCVCVCVCKGSRHLQSLKGKTIWCLVAAAIATCVYLMTRNESGLNKTTDTLQCAPALLFLLLLLGDTMREKRETPPSSFSIVGV